VMRLGASWKADPEATYALKETIAAELRTIARELDRGSGR
jgi:hypothetical protein